MKQRDDIYFKALQNDHREALSQLFDRYFHSLCCFVNTYLQDPMLAEEIVSDVFFNLWVKRKSLNITGSIRPYLFKATRNQAISYLRRPSFAYTTLEQEVRQERSLEPDAILIHKENTKQWQSHIDSLPTRCRQIFVLHREEGFTYQEIAELLEISVKTVENQMGKALQYLRKFSDRIDQRLY